MKDKTLVLIGLIFTLVLTGCITAKVVERERVDQEISGNQGYLAGAPAPTTTQAAPRTRQFIKVDVELPPYQVQKQNDDKEIWGNEGYLSGQPAPKPPKPTAIFPSRYKVTTDYESTSNQPTVTKPTLATYTVKKNDSLWKIAKRPDVYGDGNQWNKIYQANQDKIKNPNKLRPGITLVIPQD